MIINKARSVTYRPLGSALRRVSQVPQVEMEHKRTRSTDVQVAYQRAVIDTVQNQSWQLTICSLFKNIRFEGNSK